MSCRWINHEADSSDSVLDIQRVIVDKCRGSDRVDGLQEVSKTIVSECDDITFELYRKLQTCMVRY